MISSSHAAKRIGQISGLCLKLVKEQEEEAEQEAREARELGLDVETKDVTIATNEKSVYWNWHRWIQFYSKFL